MHVAQEREDHGQAKDMTKKIQNLRLFKEKLLTVISQKSTVIPWSAQESDPHTQTHTLCVWPRFGASQPFRSLHPYQVPAAANANRKPPFLQVVNTWSFHSSFLWNPTTTRGKKENIGLISVFADTPIYSISIKQD